jgi:hypothetical protein
MTKEEVWRWNVDDVWQTFSSTYQEKEFALAASNTVSRYHHLSAALLFGGCLVESFLNKELRAKLETEGVEEKNIFRRLRQTSLHEKMEKWPTELYQITLPINDIEVIGQFLDLQNEVKHRKRRDHSLYSKLDEADPSIFVQAVQRILVVVYEGANKCFPYWLLGWNYVGMNGDETYPYLINNQQFRYSLNAMGFMVPAADYYAANAWEKKSMRGLEAFKRLHEHIYDKAPDIEPKNPVFNQAPRLCKRWWDEALIRG